MHPRLLKETILNLAIPLNIIFRSSLQTRTLPDAWTRSTVVPIYKKGSRYDPLNYRPVALTSVACKVMERVLVATLWEYIGENNLISDEQFGFRTAHSTTDQLLLTYNDVTAALDTGMITDLVFFDFSKAFDRVSHGILIDKLLMIGITGSMIGVDSSIPDKA